MVSTATYKTNHCTFESHQRSWGIIHFQPRFRLKRTIHQLPLVVFDCFL